MFIRPRNDTFDRYLLLTRRQQKGQTMEQFHSALRSLPAFCQLGALEDGLLRDIFTANITDPEIQKELLKVTLAPEKALKLAISIELSARSHLAIKAKNTTDPSMVSIVGRSEPILAISSPDTGETTETNVTGPQATTVCPVANHISQTDNNSSYITVETVDNPGHKNIGLSVKPSDRHAEGAINPII